MTPKCDPLRWEQHYLNADWIGHGQRFVVRIASILNVYRKNGFCGWKPDNAVILVQFFSTICSSQEEIPDKLYVQKLTLFLHAADQTIRIMEIWLGKEICL